MEPAETGTVAAPPEVVRVTGFPWYAVTTGIVVATTVMISRFLGAFEGLELKAYDHVLAARLAEPLSDRIIVVEANRSDLETQRKAEEATGLTASISDRVLLESIEKLQNYGARIIGIDWYLSPTGLLSPTYAFDEMNLSVTELVVLSGCRTGLSQGQIGREGMTGLTSGLFDAGAERVVASLWSVQDDATRELMNRFYRLMLDPQNPMRPAAALAAAQRSMWNDPRWQTPYNWAAFTLQGEWR